MANAEVTVPMGDVVVIPSDCAEGEDPEDAKTQVILQLQPIPHGIYGDVSDTNAAVVSLETHTLKMGDTLDGGTVELSEDIDIAYPITCGESKAILLWKKFVCPGINVKCVKVRAVELWVTVAITHSHQDRKKQARRVSSHPPVAKSDKFLQSFLTRSGLVDVWRLQHPLTVDFTFFSHPHTSYSRIDMFLTSPSLIPLLHKTSIGQITWSDHADITLSVQLPQASRQWHWRLNPTLLHVPHIQENIRQAIQTFFATNKGSVPSDSMLWAAHKAVIRGTLIAEGTAHKKRKLAQLSLHLSELRRLEHLHKLTPTSDLTTQLQSHRQAIQAFMARDSKKVLLWTKQLFYEKSNKADSLLANRLRRKSLTKRIASIRAPDGHQHDDPTQIAEIFNRFYTRLYDHDPRTRQDPHASELAAARFLSGIPLPQLTTTAREVWDRVNSKNSLINTPSPLTPVLRNLQFPPGMTPQHFARFEDNNLIRLCHFFQGDRLLPFADLPQSTPLNSFDHFRYLQLRSFLSIPDIRGAATKQLTPFEKMSMHTQVLMLRHQGIFSLAHLVGV
ncbi:glucocorticoid modulatory element-binding 1 [Pelobates cultripes]|uniref:Glucocorticoid modulatory element-binding 1 n=1 Tax=Pelobates cultripes TaxID=61616 RepID=A0AAD1R1N8_PELCU|nr:glucocorticoid modulatory element-binding 1 [Pelobates cultripes]